MIVGVILAAGASSRMGGPKALARDRDQTFLARAVRTLWSACDTVVVVLGRAAPVVRRAAEAEFESLVMSGRLHHAVRSARRHGATGLEVRFVVNRAWQRGMLGSARVGIAKALTLKPDAVLVLPVDHPDVRPATVATLAVAMAEALAAFGRPRPARSTFAYALVPRVGRKRGHPLALSPTLARRVVADRGAADLSDAVRRNARLVGYLDTRDAGIVRNRNTPQA
jgi:CTP:molybdopterin cytidylyltransferase MocA